MAKIGAVINKESGTLSDEKREKCLNDIHMLLVDLVAPDDLFFVAGSEVEKKVEQLKSLGIDTLIISGGDGTVSTAARHLVDSDISLLVMAQGTRNHFAQDLNLPIKPVDAVSLIDNAHIQQIDVGEVNGHIFINNATIGLYPYIVDERKEKTKNHGLKKWSAHILSAINVIRRLPQMKVRVQAENFRTNRYTPFLFVGNNEYKELMSAGSSRSSLCDGKLWFCIPRSSGIWALIRMVWQLSLKGFEGAENLETRLLSEISIYPKKPNVRVAIDGETITMTTPLHFKIRKKSLRVIVP